MAGFGVEIWRDGKSHGSATADMGSHSAHVWATQQEAQAMIPSIAHYWGCPQEHLRVVEIDKPVDGLVIETDWFDKIVDDSHRRSCTGCQWFKKCFVGSGSWRCAEAEAAYGDYLSALQLIGE